MNYPIASKGIYGSLKMLRHLESMQSFLDGQGMPVFIYLYPTNQCNYACGYCSGQYRSDDVATELDYELLKGFLSDAKADGLKAVKVTGGEPLMYSSFCELMPFLVQLFDVGIVTNGSLLHLDSYLTALYGLAWVRFSLDAATLDTYAAIHGIEYNSKISKTLERAISKLKADSPETIVGISFVITAKNYHEIYPAAQLAKVWGADNIRFTPEQTPTGLVQATSIDLVMNELNKAERLASEDFAVFGMRHHHYENSERPEICYYAMLSCAVMATGDIYICCNTRGYPEARIGSIHDMSLSEAFANRIPVAVEGFCPVCWNDEKNRLMEAVYCSQVHENFP
jgi:MoaA/NifB/PqqE/SkfB family radical SAM enzyme